MQENFIQAKDGKLLFTKDFFENCMRKQFSDPNLTVTKANYIPSLSEKMTLELKHPKKGDRPIGVQHYQLSYIRQNKKETY
ncbi:hypothetical protein ACNVED_14705 (plasmid) [Legionella sp. D16C41]|uniref:hypothetical protein n=1 Tax=Legionella sp. D16C41 TaxID=3402688 RepID=UPI003AF6DEAF